jgi:hypothetical protein
MKSSLDRLSDALLGHVVLLLCSGHFTPAVTCLRATSRRMRNLAQDCIFFPRFCFDPCVAEADRASLMCRFPRARWLTFDSRGKLGVGTAWAIAKLLDAFASKVRHSYNTLAHTVATQDIPLQCSNQVLRSTAPCSVARHAASQCTPCKTARGFQQGAHVAAQNTTFATQQAIRVIEVHDDGIADDDTDGVAGAGRRSWPEEQGGAVHSDSAAGAGEDRTVAQVDVALTGARAHAVAGPSHCKTEPEGAEFRERLFAWHAVLGTAQLGCRAFANLTVLILNNMPRDLADDLVCTVAVAVPTLRILSSDLDNATPITRVTPPSQAHAHTHARARTHTHTVGPGDAGGTCGEPAHAARVVLGAGAGRTGTCGNLQRATRVRATDNLQHAAMQHTTCVNATYSIRHSTPVVGLNSMSRSIWIAPHGTVLRCAV